MDILILLTILIIIGLAGYIYYIRRNATYVKSLNDNNYYLVRKLHDKQEAADLLALIRGNIIKISENSIKEYTSEPYYNYMKTLFDKTKNIRITENIYNNKYTSYSVEKGEELVFCLRSKLLENEIHDINLLMYVVIHELAHIACPEYGHTPLFKDIFAKLTKLSIKIGVYKRIDFNITPEEYCGIQITDSII